MTIEIDTSAGQRANGLLAAMFVWVWPTPLEYAWLALIGGLLSAGHFALMKALQLADVSALEPINFTRLIWGAPRSRLTIVLNAGGLSVGGGDSPRSRQDQRNNSSLAGNALDFQGTAMQLGEGFRDGQPQPGAFVATRQAVLFHLIERRQDAREIIGLDADAGVAHGNYGPVVFVQPASGGDRAAVGRKLNRVGEEVHQDLPDLDIVGDDHGLNSGARSRKFDGFPAGPILDQRQAILDHLIEINFGLVKAVLTGLDA